MIGARGTGVSEGSTAGGGSSKRVLLPTRDGPTADAGSHDDEDAAQ